MAEDKLVAEHYFEFDINHGGEGLILRTKYFDNGDDELYSEQTLTLDSYCNSASLFLVGTPLTPELLRRLADELDDVKRKAGY
jgi:hypothetical protein